ncbi:MAG: hypothetical protein ACEQSB_00605 [Undibacterium sp.]
MKRKIGMKSNFGCLFFAAIPMLLIAAWFTHIFVCLKAAAWGLLIGGAIFFPVGIIHGVGVWFGVW